MVLNFADCCAVKKKKANNIPFRSLSSPHEFSLEVLSLFLGRSCLQLSGKNFMIKHDLLLLGWALRGQQPKVVVGTNWVVVIFVWLSALVRSE